jgi:hypothetical protein
VLVATDLPNAVSSARRARAFVRAVLATWELEAYLTSGALVVSELVATARRSGDARTLHLAVGAGDGDPWVEVGGLASGASADDPLRRLIMRAASTRSGVHRDSARPAVRVWLRPLDTVSAASAERTPGRAEDAGVS